MFALKQTPACSTKGGKLDSLQTAFTGIEGSPHFTPRQYPASFGKKLATLMDVLKSSNLGAPNVPNNIPTAEEIFGAMEWGSVWPEANLVQTVHYLRGSKHLRIPESFRQLLPTAL